MSSTATSCYIGFQRASYWSSTGSGIHQIGAWPETLIGSSSGCLCGRHEGARLGLRSPSYRHGDLVSNNGLVAVEWLILLRKIETRTAPNEPNVLRAIGAGHCCLLMRLQELLKQYINSPLSVHIIEEVSWSEIM